MAHRGVLLSMVSLTVAVILVGGSERGVFGSQPIVNARASAAPVQLVQDKKPSEEQKRRQEQDQRFDDQYNRQQQERQKAIDEYRQRNDEYKRRIEENQRDRK